MKVLVTGGAGFLGSYVVQALLAAGHEPLVFDTTQPRQGPFFRGDLTQIEDILAASTQMDALCHLAAVGDVDLALENPPLAALMNVVGTATMLQAALRNRLRRVVYASTWEVYGPPRYQPIDEEHPCVPDHPYSITKLSGEQLALSYDHLKGVPVIALRLGTAYGLGMRSNAVFSRFLENACKGRPLSIHGHGHQSRQFTHARDIGRAFVAALESNLHGRAYNIVANDALSIKQLAEMIVSAFPTDIVFTDARPGDASPAIVKSTKARQELGWSARVPFQEGLQELLRQKMTEQRL